MRRTMPRLCESTSLPAAQGHAGAQFNSGYMFEEGQGVAQDTAEAIRWYRLAASQGYARATIGLKLLGSWACDGHDTSLSLTTKRARLCRLCQWGAGDEPKEPSSPTQTLYLISKHYSKSESCTHFYTHRQNGSISVSIDHRVCQVPRALT